MALSGEKIIDIGGGAQHKITWSASQNIAGNYSDITVKTYVIARWGWITGSYTTGKSGIKGKAWGASYSIGGEVGNSWKYLGSSTTRVDHSSDGTLSTVIMAEDTFNVTYRGVWIGTVATSAGITLNTIPRTSELTLSSGGVLLGAVQTINTNRKSTSFSHIAYYSYRGQDWTLIANNISTSHAWTLPNSLANKIPSATSGELTIKLDTYQGSTYIGSSTKNFTMVVPHTTEFYPTCSIDSIAEANPSLSGLGVYLDKKSELNIKSSSAGKYGSVIRTHKITVTRTGGGSYDGTNITTNRATSSGTAEIQLTVTDSRGYERKSYSEVSFKTPISASLDRDTANLGSKLSIYSGRTSSKINSKVYFENENWTYEQATATMGDIYDFIIPYRVATRLPNTRSGTMLIRVEGYYGTYEVGSTTMTLNLYVPDDETTKPSLAITSISDLETAQFTRFGNYVQNRSWVSVKSSSGGKLNSSISQHKVTVTGGGTHYSKDFKTRPTEAGYVGIQLTVTDSRGISNTTYEEIVVLPYHPPRINFFYARRTPTHQDIGALTEFGYEIAPVDDKNVKSIEISYREKGAVGWTELVKSHTHYSQQSSRTDSGILNLTKAYEFQFTVTDYFTNQTNIVDVGTSYQLINFNKSGKGIGIGTVSTKDAFEINMPMEMSSMPLVSGSPILERSSNANGNWTKFADGTMMCYQKVQYASTAEGYIDYKLPMDFVNDYVFAGISMSFDDLAGNKWIIADMKDLLVAANKTHWRVRSLGGSYAPSYILFAYGSWK